MSYAVVLNIRADIYLSLPLTPVSAAVITLFYYIIVIIN